MNRPCLNDDLSVTSCRCDEYVASIHSGSSCFWKYCAFDSFGLKPASGTPGLRFGKMIYVEFFGGIYRHEF